MKRLTVSNIPFALGLSIGTALATAALATVYLTGIVTIQREASDLADRVRVFQRVDAERSRWPTIRAGETYDGVATDWSIENGNRNLVYAGEPTMPYAFRLQATKGPVPVDPSAPRTRLDFLSNQRATFEIQGPDGLAKVTTRTGWSGIQIVSALRRATVLRQPISDADPDWTALLAARDTEPRRSFAGSKSLRLLPMRNYVLHLKAATVTVVRVNRPATVEFQPTAGRLQAHLAVPGIAPTKFTSAYVGTAPVDPALRTAEAIASARPRALTSLLAEAKSVKSIDALESRSGR